MISLRQYSFIIILLLVAIVSKGQSNQIYSGAYTNDLNGPGYFAPLSDVLASNFSAQSYSTHYKSGFGIHIGVIGVRSLISDSQRTHLGRVEGAEQSGTLEVPTIFGAPSAVIAEDASGGAYGFPGGFALNTVTLLIPQVTISTPVNTDVSFRFFAHDFGGEFGELSMIGGGIRHHLDPYFGLDERIHLSVGYFYNQLSVDQDIISHTLHAVQAEFGFEVDKFFIPYANVQYLQSTLGIDYVESGVVTAFSGQGNQSLRAEVGFSIRLKPLAIRAGLHVLGTPGYSAIVGFTF